MKLLGWIAGVTCRRRQGPYYIVVQTFERAGRTTEDGNAVGGGCARLAVPAGSEES